MIGLQRIVVVRDGENIRNFGVHLLLIPESLANAENSATSATKTEKNADIAVLSKHLVYH